MYEQIASHLSAYRQADAWVVAFSGGLDSTVLLDLLVKARAANNLPSIKAIHINHQLQDEANSWQRHCVSVCQSIGVDIHTSNVDVKPSGQGIEAAARDARYAVFERQLGAQEILLSAHHADDQLETLLLRLMRGSGVKGMAGVAPSRKLGAGQIVRPLLGVTRAQLAEYARGHKLTWIEDPSNLDVQHDRNYLRHQVIPALKSRWPSASQSAARSAALMSVQSQYLEADIADAKNTCVDPEGHLHLQRLKAFELSQQLTILRSWIAGCSEQLLSQVQTEQLAKQMLEAKPDAEPQYRLACGSVRRFDERLYWVPTAAEISSDLCIDWDGGTDLRLPELGLLKGSALSRAAYSTYQVRFRKAGDRAKPVGRQRSQSLKKLLQEYRVPPWTRDTLPVIVLNDSIVAVVGVFTVASHPEFAELRIELPHL